MRKKDHKQSMGMNKRRVITVILDVIAGMLLIAFGLLLWKDHEARYPYGSAPFYLYVIERAIELAVPAALCIAAGVLIQRRTGKDHF